MKLISTGVERFLTSDEVADHIVEYAGVLARAGSADVIEIRVLSETGHTADAKLLLGPASQISLVPSDALDIPMADAETVAELVRRIRHYEPVTSPEDDLAHVGPAEVFSDLETSGGEARA